MERVDGGGIMSQLNSHALTLALSRRLAIAEGRNAQQAMIHTARTIRSETKNQDTYASLGIFLTATPAEKDATVALTERMFLEYEIED
jgi:hypothetical protein